MMSSGTRLSQHGSLALNQFPARIQPHIQCPPPHLCVEYCRLGRRYGTVILMRKGLGLLMSFYSWLKKTDGASVCFSSTPTSLP